MNNYSLDRDRALVAAREFIVATEQALALEQARQTRRSQDGHLAQVAVGVAAMASMLLSRRDRTRYAEEYQREIADLAAAGAGRWRQLSHAGRLLAKAGPMRVTLTWAHQHHREIV